LTDVLTLDKMENGQFDLTLKPACLQCLVMACARLFRPVAESKDINFVTTCSNLAASKTDIALMAKTDITEAVHFPAGLSVIPHQREVSSSIANIDAACSHSVGATTIVDALRLNQIIRNLLSNAFKFTCSHGLVSMELTYDAVMAHVTVIDTGVGMDEESLSKLFKPYVQFENDLQKGQGSGLGLSIAKRLAQLHGGDLICISEQGAGSKFILSLPLVPLARIKSADAPEEAPDTTASSPPDTNSQPGATPSPDFSLHLRTLQAHRLRSLKKSSRTTGHVTTGQVEQESKRIEFELQPMTDVLAATDTHAIDIGVQDEAGACATTASVSPQSSSVAISLSLPSSVESTRHPRKRKALVVDDSDLNVRLLCRLLQTRGWDTSKASNGQQACDCVQAAVHEFDVVFMDYNMPVMDGSDAVRVIRAAGFQGRIVGLTGDVSVETVELFTSAGANSVMTKPFDVRALDALLATFS